MMFLGCSDSGPAGSTSEKETKLSTPNTHSSTTAVRLHWLGKKRIAADSSAANVMAIWNLPESARLEAQTLDKLSTAPWRLLKTTTPLSNAPVALLRPLIDDIVQEESYLEIRGATNRPGEVVFAIRLDANRAALWETNLPLILQTLVPTQTPDPKSQTPEFQVSRSGDWTLLALTSGSGLKTPDSGLLADFRERIQRDQVPFLPQTTNYWLDAEAEAHLLNDAFALGWDLPKLSPRIALKIFGEGGNVRTLAGLDFPGPVPIELELWNIPTNLVHDPLIGFSAIRGIRHWARYLRPWRDLPAETLPNQLYFWAQSGTAPLRFFAAPSSQASNQLQLLSQFILDEVNPRVAIDPQVKIGYGAFERVTNSLQLRWRGMPYVSPNLDLADAGGNPFITGGLFFNRMTNLPPPEPLLQQVRTIPNLFYYDWEITEPVEYGWLQPAQVGRFVFGRARLSMTNNGALPWLVAIAPKLGNAVTVGRLESSNHISIVRSSTLGFTGVELHFLADWLEAPNFPHGFFTLDATPTPFVTTSNLKTGDTP